LFCHEYVWFCGCPMYIPEVTFCYWIVYLVSMCTYLLSFHGIAVILLEYKTA
jgi:hypothetical protein